MAKNKKKKAQDVTPNTSAEQKKGQHHSGDMHKGTEHAH